MNKYVEEIRSAFARLIRPSWWCMVHGRNTDFDFTEKVLAAMSAGTLRPVVYADFADPEGKLPHLAYRAVIVVDGVITDSMWIGNEINVGYGYEISETGTCEHFEGFSVYHHRKQEVMDYLRRCVAGGDFYDDTEWWQLLSKEQKS